MRGPKIDRLTHGRKLAETAESGCLCQRVGTRGGVCTGCLDEDPYITHLASLCFYVHLVTFR